MFIWNHPINKTLCFATKDHFLELSNFVLGSYRCICNRGYKPDMSTSSTKCIDVNECLQRPGPCEHECTNSWGSYTCSCPTGYVLNRSVKFLLNFSPLDVYYVYMIQQWCLQRHSLWMFLGFE